MAEINTCEQYVLNRLEELENENACLKCNLATTMAALDRIQTRENKIKEILNKYGEIRTLTSGKRYINVDVNEYSAESEYAFNKLVRFAHIKTEEEKEKERKEKEE